MLEHPSYRLAYWHHVIVRSARALGDTTGDLVSVGWVSALARGGPEGVRAAQAAYLAALRAAR